MWDFPIKRGQDWTLSAQLGQLKQDKVGRDFCKVIGGAPTTVQGYGIEKTINIE